MKQLPAGRNRDRTILYDNQWQPIWDSATATTPAYQHIPDHCNAQIDHADGTRWVGQFYRCPEGHGDTTPCGRNTATEEDA